MEIKVTVKQLGKKHPFLKEKILKIKNIGYSPSLKALLEAIVEQQVEEYNKETEPEDKGSVKIPKNNYLPLLTDTGKVGFGNIYNSNKADIEEAKKTAIQAFEDGMYTVFLNEEELTNINQSIDIINTEKIITLIRLTFLAGSYW